MNSEIPNRELLEAEPKPLLAVEFARTLPGVQNNAWDGVVVLDNTPTRVRIEINTLIRPFSAMVKLKQDGRGIWGIIEAPDSLIIHNYSRAMDPEVANLKLKPGLSRPRVFTTDDIDHPHSHVRPTSVFSSSHEAVDFLAKLASAIRESQNGSS